MFQHTAARRRLGVNHLLKRLWKHCFNTQPPEGGWNDKGEKHAVGDVSTHSRPKAAGFWVVNFPILPRCFNTQPPEGGWVEQFNQAFLVVFVSTHSRPKAAGAYTFSFKSSNVVSTHSRPKAAGIKARTHR